MKYFKVSIFLTTEELAWDQTEQAYIGYNPDSIQNHGLVEEIQRASLRDLMDELYKKYSVSLEHVIDNHFEYECDGEHDYRTPKDERVPFREIYSFFFNLVEETPIAPIEVKNQIERIKRRK